MSRDGNGTYSLPAGNPVVTGNTISSTVQNNTMTDVASALTGSIASDGQTTPTADLKMGGFKHKNVANASSRISTNANYASAADVQDGTITYLTTVAGTNTITASAPLGLAAYATGQKFSFIPAVTNTAPTTINVNSIGAKNIFSNGQACGGNELIAGQPVTVIYDGTQFNVIAGSSAFVDTYFRIKGSADATKQVRNEVDGLTTGTTRTWTYPDSNDTYVGKATTDVLTNKTLTSPVLNTGVTGTALATQAQQEAGTAVDVLVTSGRQQFHPSAAKGWIKADAAGAGLASYNVTSVTDTGVGQAKINWATVFSSANYSVHVTPFIGSGATVQAISYGVEGQAAGSTDVWMYRSSGAAAVLLDPTNWNVTAYGDQ